MLAQRQVYGYTFLISPGFSYSVYAVFFGMIFGFFLAHAYRRARTAEPGRTGKGAGNPENAHSCRRFARGFDRDSRALPQLVAAACQVGGLGGVARQLDGFVVRRARVLAAAKPAQRVGAGRMVGVIAGQLVLETVDGRQCHFRAVKLGDRDGPVEGDDRRGSRWTSWS